MIDLYPSVLGKDWMRLADPVRTGHRAGLRARGRFTVIHGKSILAKLVAWLARFPPAGSTKLSLAIDGKSDREVWTRHFGDHELVTTQVRLPDGRVGERQGPLEVKLRLRVKDGALIYRSEGAAFVLGPLRIPIGFLAPRVKARAWADSNSDSDSGWMRVRVAIAVPIVGLVLGYRGRIKPRGA